MDAKERANAMRVRVVLNAFLSCGTDRLLRQLCEDYVPEGREDSTVG